MSLQRTKAQHSLDLKYIKGSKKQETTSAGFICHKTKKEPVGSFFFGFEKAYSCLSAYTGLPVAVLNDW